MRIGHSTTIRRLDVPSRQAKAITRFHTSATMGEDLRMVEEQRDQEDHQDGGERDLAEAQGPDADYTR